MTSGGGGVIIASIILLPLLGLGIYYFVQHGLPGLYGGTTVECTSAKVFQEHPEYKSMVADAASKYLEGDQAILISLIQAESGWDKDNRNPTSSATGLGQFLDTTNPTENGKPFFNFISPDGADPDDDRRNPVIAIPATAFYFKTAIDRSKADSRVEGSKLLLYRSAYIWYYHTGGEDSEGATTGAKNILNFYSSMLENGECKQVGSGGGGGWSWPLGRPFKSPRLDNDHGSFFGAPSSASADYGTADGVEACTPLLALGSGTVEFKTGAREDGYYHADDKYMYKDYRGYNAIFTSSNNKVVAVYAHIYRKNIASQPVFQVVGGEQFATVYPWGSSNENSCNKQAFSNSHLHFQLKINDIWINGSQQASEIQKLIATNQADDGGVYDAEKGKFDGNFEVTQKSLNTYPTMNTNYNKPTYIILHYLGTVGNHYMTVNEAWNYFENINKDNNEENNKYVQYVVAQSGKIYQFLPETKRVAGACGFNAVPSQYGGGISISIENEGHFEGRFPPTSAQIQANQRLVKYLMSKYTVPESKVVSHGWAYLNGTPEECDIRSDPGDAFMQAVLNGL